MSDNPIESEIQTHNKQEEKQIYDKYRTATVTDLSQKSDRTPYDEAFTNQLNYSPEFTPALNNALETHRVFTNPDGTTTHFLDLTEISQIVLDHTPTTADEANADDTMLKRLISAVLPPNKPNRLFEDSTEFNSIAKIFASILSKNHPGFTKYSFHKMGLAENLNLPGGKFIDKNVKDYNPTRLIAYNDNPLEPKSGEKLLLAITIPASK